MSPDSPMSLIGERVGASTAIVLTIVMVQFVGFEDPVDAAVSDEKSAALTVGSLQMLSPIKGEVIALESVADEAFAGKMPGDGIAIIPHEGKVVAPCDAQVATLIDSHHAIGLICDNGAKLLIHDGLNTVNLQGQYFTPLVGLAPEHRCWPLIKNILSRQVTT
ncbi:PTS sugar transporter subunit IIA [Kosakonia quasisacchari]|uniref:PTS sugar transporter subunit IIA n=1 Tax=Kosakonia quasisacchari TaxID=2529380 RepID=UPI001F33ECA2